MVQFDEPLTHHLPDVIISTVTIMGCAYTIVYYLIPRYLQKGRNGLFVLFTILSILTSALLYALLLDIYTWFEVGKLLRNLPILILSHTVETSLHSSIFIAVFLVYYWYKNDQLAKRFEKEKLEAELNFLKAQINPHFLFNALNSIFVLIDLDKTAASDTLLKFSDLLRYQLYECSGKSISLSSELNFLSDYISLESLRHGEYVNIEFEKPDKIPHFTLEPLLLIPFVENAFKHVSKNPAKKNFVRIKAEANNTTLRLSVSNTHHKQAAMNGHDHGIGLQNVKRRLQLLYPEDHKLSIVDQDGLFTVNLTLYAKQYELHHNRR
jgi:sensor histidine kinase YesM